MQIVDKPQKMIAFSPAYPYTNIYLKGDTELFRVIGKESEPGARRYGKMKRRGWDSDYVFSAFLYREESGVIVFDLRFCVAMRIYGPQSDSPF